MKLGSLFDGSGGFPLAGSLCGITPSWAAEVEPYPIAVTRTHFPSMIHLGDVSKVRGGEIEPVDIITFGSPCQDLSTAGKQAGIRHEAKGDGETTRSGLFMEAVRVIREMRDATNGLYPRFALWENVYGAYISNNGEDFRVVLETLIKIMEPRAAMPPVPPGGWPYADWYRGDGWSLAYRLFDAQYWGVPQRRRRIHLVFDFRGQSAGRVLFERDSVQGHPFTDVGVWKETAGAGDPGAAKLDRGGCAGRDVIYATDPGWFTTAENISPTLLANLSANPIIITSRNENGQWSAREIMPTEAAKLQGFPAHWGDIEPMNRMDAEDYAFWLNVRATYAEINGKARRDWSEKDMLAWYNSLHTKYSEYKMWGNGIALPPALYCMQGMAAELKEGRDE